MPDNELRIIGGSWRSRRLHFSPVDGLRPTPGRIRETLFNWLQHDIAGARCLDLFAGSGALGFEAASRGAASVMLIEKHPLAVQALRDNCEKLGAGHLLRVVRDDACRFLRHNGRGEQFDLVFMDPPFSSELLEPCLVYLEQGGWLASGACIYVETAVKRQALRMPAFWDVWKECRAGDVSSRLFRRSVQVTGLVEELV